jgi:hypothetical protein
VTGTNNITFTHYRVRWRDSKILAALGAGLRLIFPRIGQTYTTVFQTATNIWEYSLPPDFNDPRTRITSVELQEVPYMTERYHPITTWRRVGLNSIKLSDGGDLPPGTNIRVTYWGPYRSLSDLEDQLQWLPVLYAKYKLLSDKEALRARGDIAAITQDAGANQPGTQMTVALAYLQEFNDALLQLKRGVRINRVTSTYSA